MKNYNFTTIEGVKHKVKLNITGIQDRTDYRVYGYCSKIGCYCGQQIEEEEEDLLIVPPLQSGIYTYQIFILRKSTNQEFQLLNGRIEVENRLEEIDFCPIGQTNLEVSYDAEDTIVELTIVEGTKGEKGDKGDKGDGADISEETIKEMLPMVWDTPTPSTANQYFKNGVVIGENNKGGSSKIYIFGKDNEATQNTALLVGFNNLSKSGTTAIFGSYNQISGQSNNVFGESNIISHTCNSNVVVGKQNRPMSSFNVIVGSENETFLLNGGNYNFIFGVGNYISGQSNVVLGQTNFVSGVTNATIGYRNAVCYQSPGNEQVIGEGCNITIGTNNFVGGGFDFGFFTSNTITLGNRSSNHKNNSVVIGHDISAKNDNSIILCASDTNNGVKVSMELTAGKATGKMGDLGSGEPFVTDCFITFYIEDVLGGMTQRTKINLKNFLEVFSAHNGETEHEMIQTGGYYY